jgi:DNA polymerase-3 subunit delta'
LRPLDETALATELETRLPDMKANERSELARLAGGSIGAALRLAGDDGLMLAGEADRLIDRADSPDLAAILALADKIGRIEDGTDQFGNFLLDALQDRIRLRVRDPRAPAHAGMERWVALWERLGKSFHRTEALHLEPRQTILSAAQALAQTARRGSL